MVTGFFLYVFTASLVVGLISSAFRMRNPDAAKKCYLAFILFAGGWLILVGMTLMAESSIGFIVFGALGLAGVVLAMRGLSELRDEPGRIGRAPAIATLVLACMVLAGLGIQMMARLMSGFA